MANNSADNLRLPKEGDRPSAGQARILANRAKALAKSNGPGMTVTSDGMILTRRIPAAPGVKVVRLRYHSSEEDYIVCHSWNGVTEGSDAINVAFLMIRRPPGSTLLPDGTLSTTRWTNALIVA